MREQTVEEEREQAYTDAVREGACRMSMALIYIALGSLKDELTELRISLIDYEARRGVDPLLAEKASRFGPELLMAAVEQLYADLPFTSKQVVNYCNDAHREIHVEGIAQKVDDFIRGMKPCVKK